MAYIPTATLLANPDDPILASEWNQLVYRSRDWFNVLDYGAVPGTAATWATTPDSTAAIQAAIDACAAAGGGEVFFPAGIYRIGGALRANTNCQLEIPFAANGAAMGAITLRGGSPNSFNGSEGFMQTSEPQTGVILKSTIAGTGTKPAVIGAAYQAVAVFGNFNFANLHLENLTIEVKSRDGQGADIPVTMSGVNAENLAVLNVRWVRVRPESDNYTSVQPAAGTYGVIYPHYNNKAIQQCEYLYVQGFHTGIVITEHFVATRLAVVSCYNGLVASGPATQHPATILHAGIEICVNNIVQESGIKVNIFTYQNERLQLNDGSGNPRWNNYQRDVLHQNGGAGLVKIFDANATRSGIGPDATFKATDPSLVRLVSGLNELTSVTIQAG